MAADGGRAVPPGPVLPARRRDDRGAVAARAGRRHPACWPSISSARGERDGRPHAAVLPAEAMDLVRAYTWPGNVRQLENTVRRLVVTSPEEEITRAEVEAVLGNQPAMEPLRGGGEGEKLSASVAQASAALFRPAWRRAAAARGSISADPARGRSAADRDRARRDRRKSGEMCRSAGHQPQYFAQEDHRPRYSRDTPPQVDVKPQQVRGASASARRATTRYGGRDCATSRTLGAFPLRAGGA